MPGQGLKKCGCGKNSRFPCCARIHTMDSFNNPERQCVHCRMTREDYLDRKTPDRIRTT